MRTSLILMLLSVLFITACANAPVTGRRQFMLVSEETAIKASEPAYYEMLKEPKSKGKINTDSKISKRVDAITARLIAQAITYRPETQDWNWSVHVIDDPETVNAWCMAGGRMAIYTGLLDKVKPTDDELAQVMGHEIAHALAKHTAEKMSTAMATNLAVNVLAATQDNPGWALTGGSLAAALAVTLPNSRTAETEADRIGIELAAKAGYDPRASVTLWNKMAATSQSGTPEFLSTHPAPDTRIQTLKQLIPQMQRYYNPNAAHPSYRFKPQAMALP